MFLPEQSRERSQLFEELIKIFSASFLPHQDVISCIIKYTNFSSPKAACLRFQSNQLSEFCLDYYMFP